MLTELIYPALVVSGIVAAWTKLLKDNKEIKARIRQVAPWPLSKALTCSFCLTYWLALAYLFVQSEFSVFKWFALSMLAALIHWTFAALYETHHYLRHQIEAFDQK